MRSFGPCRSARMAMGRLKRASRDRIVSTLSRRRSRGRWLMLSRNTSAPASNSRAIISGLSEAGPRVAMILVRRARFMLCPLPESRRCPKPRLVSLGRGRWSARSARIGKLNRPALLLAGIDFEEPVAVETAGQAILHAADRELAVSGAHEGAAAPLAAAVVIDGVDVIEARLQGSLKQRFAAARVQVPPAFRHPALAVAVAERDADAARGHVAHAQIGAGRSAPARRGQGNG